MIPSISETAATPKLLIARWLVFLSVMAAIGLAALRLAIARPVIRRVSGRHAAGRHGRVLRSLQLRRARLDPRLRPAGDRRLRPSLVLLVRCAGPARARSAFGRGYVDLWLCFALFVAAAALRSASTAPSESSARSRSCSRSSASLSRARRRCSCRASPVTPHRPRRGGSRSSSTGCTSPPARSGSAGLIGLLVLWRSLPDATRVAGLVVAVPRFSNTAFVVRAAAHRLRTGASLLHLPTVASLWQTSYGQALLVKIALLLAAMRLASVNLLRTKPGCAQQRRRRARRDCSSPRRGGDAARRRCGVRRRGLVVARTAVESTRLGRRRGRARRAGPRGEDRQDATATPSSSASAPTRRPCRTRSPSRSRATASRSRGADVVTTFEMLDMEMGNQAYRLQRDDAGRLPPCRPRARDGRALGAFVQRHAARPRAVRRPARRQGSGMTIRARLALALLALCRRFRCGRRCRLLARSVLG